MVAIFGYSRAEIAEAVKAMYTAVATTPQAFFHFPVGRAGCRVAGYSESLLSMAPESAIASFAGVGCPFRSGEVMPGERVLDIGAGAGLDSLIAARMAGAHGRVYALDMTPAMTAKLRDTAAKAGIDNLEVVEGTAEDLPLPDASVDVIISNGVLNLVPGKRQAMAEMFRVLCPGGRVQIADIVIKRPVTPDCLGDPKLWAECVVGATVDEEYLEMFRDAGFEDVKIVHSYDYFAHSPAAETREVAQSFDARSIELSMRRASAYPRWTAVVKRRADPRRLIRHLGRRGLGGIVALVLALAACYGTIAALGGLAMLGMTVAVNKSAWAFTITALAVVTALFVLAGWGKHKRLGPPSLAGCGAGLIAYAMTINYDAVIEGAGFALLAAGTLWDFRIRRYHGSPRSLHASRIGQRPRGRSENSPTIPKPQPK